MHCGIVLWYLRLHLYKNKLNAKLEKIINVEMKKK